MGETARYSRWRGGSQSIISPYGIALRQGFACDVDGVAERGEIGDQSDRVEREKAQEAAEIVFELGPKAEEAQA